MSSEISSLLKVISTNVEALGASLNDVSFPSIDDPEIPRILTDPQFRESANLIVSAASRLVAAFQVPHLALANANYGMYTSALLNVAVEANVAEALKEAGPQGLHVRDLGQKVGVEPSRLGRCLRYLCMQHIFREVSPNVFANNRLSTALDTAKPFDEVKDRSPHRYDGASGLASWVGHTTDEGLKGANFISETLLDPKNSTGSLDTVPFKKGAGSNLDYFAWLESKGNEKRLHRFGAAMRNTAAMFPPDLILTSYDWSSLPKNSLVVDVGGGVGTSTLPLARKYPDLRFMVQDRPPVIADAEKFWQSELPEAIQSNQVQLKPHNFFNPQPIKEAAVFMLRAIIHDWPKDQAHQILQALRKSAGDNTRLLLIELILPYACPIVDESIQTIPGAAESALPEVLRGNPGAAAAFTCGVDIQMLNFFDSQERTVGEWDELVKSAGWKLESMKRGAFPSIVCVPV